jgi:hypothetical protein
MRSRWTMLALVLAGVIGLPPGAETGFAEGSKPLHRRPTEHLAPKSNKATMKPCQSAFNIGFGTLIPPDDLPSDNPPASRIEMINDCAGTVLGTFMAETVVPHRDGFIHIDMRATCLGPARFADACKTGDQVIAFPPHTFLQTSKGSAETHGMIMAWPKLKKGHWRFEVLPGGDGESRIQFRTFRIDTFDGG